MLNIDISKLSYPDAVQWLVPVIPGGVLVTGLLLTQNEIEAAFFAETQISSGMKVAIALFAAYVVGFVLSSLVRIIEYFIGYSLGWWIGTKRDLQPTMEPYGDQAWRRAARKLIGEDLAPSTDERYDPRIHAMQKEAAEKIADCDERQRALWAVELRQLEMRLADGEWYRWYQVLKNYFYRPNPELSIGMSSLLALQTTGWTGLILLLVTPLKHWFLWVTCILSIIFGIAGEMATWGFGSDPDRWGHKLTAEILQEVKKRESAQGSHIGDQPQPLP
jgi:hypothetical protein